MSFNTLVGETLSNKKKSAKKLDLLASLYVFNIDVNLNLSKVLCRMFFSTQINVK